MTERLLTLDEVPDRGAWIVVGDQQTAILLPDEVPAIAAELDRLYAAAEANQAPGPDWKAKLRQEVEGLKRQAEESTAARWVLVDVLALIDALPDPPTPDPDAPPVYVPPEGHYVVLGKNVPDGWKGRPWVNGSWWWSADECRNHYDILFEVRRVPAPEPATEWVPVHEALATERVADSPGVGPFVVARVVRAPDGPVLAMSTDGSRYVHVREDGMVLVLAEGER